MRESRKQKVSMIKITQTDYASASEWNQFSKIDSELYHQEKTSLNGWFVTSERFHVMGIYLNKGVLIHFTNGILSNGMGPSIIASFSKNTACVHFFKNGQVHNEEGPGFVLYLLRDESEVSLISLMKMPFKIDMNNPNLNDHRFYLEGVEYSKEEYDQKMIAIRNKKNIKKKIEGL